MSTTDSTDDRPVEFSARDSQIQEIELLNLRVSKIVADQVKDCEKKYVWKMEYDSEYRWIVRIVWTGASLMAVSVCGLLFWLIRQIILKVFP
jgi:hypothetical protein